MIGMIGMNFKVTYDRLSLGCIPFCACFYVVHIILSWHIDSELCTDERPSKALRTHACKEEPPKNKNNDEDDDVSAL